MKAKNSYIVYFLTRSLFLGFGFSLLFNASGKDSYIGMALGLFIGLLFTYLYTYIIKCKNGKALKEIFSHHKIIGLITRILFLLVSILLLLYILVIYKIFVVSFLLVASPEIFVTVPFIILSVYAAFKSLKVIRRLAGSLLPISIIISIIIFTSLTGFFESTNFLPILDTKPIGIIKTAMIFGGLVAFPNILTLHFKSDTDGYIKIYIITALILIIYAICIVGVFGESLLTIFRFPEYMVLKQIKLFQFVEKIENVLSVVWIFDLLITTIMGIYSIKECLPEKRNKLYTIGILLVLIYVIDNFFAFNYVNELKIYSILPIISIVIPIVISLLVLYLTKMKKS